jgi:voltage-gated potassium channel
MDDSKDRKNLRRRDENDNDNSGESIRSLLFRGSRISPIQNVSMRIGVAILALVITSVIVYLERGCYSDGGVVGELSFVDAFYYSTVSLSTTGYGDIVPVCESSRIVNVLVITPLRFLFLIVLIGTTIEVLTKKTRSEIRSRQWRKKVQNHTIIIGYGVKGRSAAKALLDAGYNANSIVVVSPDRESCDLATRDGLVAFVGDGRQEEVLQDVSIERAGQIIVATNEDDTSVLVTLTARRLAPPDAKIIAAVRESQNADVMRQSGANSVIPTAESAGRLMGLSVISSEAGALMEDLLDSSRGLEVTERSVTKEELSMSPGDLNEKGQIILAVIRNGVTHRFYTESIRFLEQGDRMVVIKYHQEEG